MKKLKKAKNIKDAVMISIRQNFDKYEFPRETDNDIAMYAVRGDMLFEALGKLYI